jgi:hypothetical protein
MRWFTVPMTGVLLGTLLPVAAVHAAQWKRLYTAPDRSVEMDLSGIRRRGDIVMAWVKFSYQKDQTDKVKGPYRSMLQLWAYQCGLGRHSLMQFTEYTGAGGDGKVVASDAHEQYDWSYPEPDTIGDAALKVACSYAPKSTATGAETSL